MSTLQHTVLQQMIFSGRGFNTNYLSQRCFHRNEGTTDYATIPEVTLTGDFVIEFESIADTPSSNASLLGGSGPGVNHSKQFTLFLNDVGALSVKVPKDSSGSYYFSIPYVPSRYEKTIFKKEGDTITLTHGTESTSITKNDYASIRISNLYRWGNGLYLNGILANLKIWDNGTLIRDYPINDGKNILANAATALGSELDGLTYALTTAIGGVASVVLSSLSVIGKTYLVEVSYSGVVGDASVRIGGFSGPSFTGTGSQSFVATAITTVNDILGALTGVTSGSVTVSLKEADGYGTIINGNADDWGLFDKQANGDWKGNGLAVPPWDSVDQVLVAA